MDYGTDEAKKNEPDDGQSVVKLRVDSENAAPEEGVKSGRLEGVGFEKGGVERPRKKQWLRKKDPDAEILKIQRPKRENPEDAWSKEEQPAKKAWLVGGVITVVCLLAGGLLWALTTLDKGSEKAVQESQQIAENRQNSVQKDKDAETMVQEMEDVVKNFVEAKSVEEMSQYVRYPKRVKPMMEKYYKIHPLEVMKLDSIEKRVPVEVGNHSFWVISYQLKGGKGRSQVLIGQDDQGRWAVDWESKVVYQPSDWDKFRKNKTTKPQLFRVYLEYMERSPFYGFEFSDYNKYRAFKVTVKDNEEYLWGYTIQGSKDDKALMEMVEKGAKASPLRSPRIPVMVKLRFLEDSMSDRCVVIDELVGTTWTLVEPDKLDE